MAQSWASYHGTMTNAAARFILGSTLTYGCTFGLLGCNTAPENMPKSVLYEKASQAELEGDAQSASELYRVVALRYPGDWRAKFDTTTHWMPRVIDSIQ